MAQFRGTVLGSGQTASRTGGKASGLDVTANGWNLGVTVHGRTDHDGNDSFKILMNGGSNLAFPAKHIGTVIIDAEGNPKFIPA